MKFKIEKEFMSPLTDLPKEFEIIEYESLKKCYAASWNCEPNQLDWDSTDGFVDINGKPQNVNLSYVIDDIAEHGIWGWTHDNEMHIWVDRERAEDIEIISFFSHELAHHQKPNKRDYLQEEQKAEHYSDITRFAYKMFTKIKG